MSPSPVDQTLTLETLPLNDSSRTSTNAQPLSGSAIQMAVGGLGEFFENELAKVIPYNPVPSRFNSVIGQLDGTVPKRTLGERKGGVSAPNWKTVLRLEARRYIGLLRSPWVNESAVTQFDYNLSMADEALRLGEKLREQFKSGTTPAFYPVWESCRAWRVNQLDELSDISEVKMFSEMRVSPRPNLVTPIIQQDVRYNYLLDGLLEKAAHSKKTDRLAQPDYPLQLKSSLEGGLHGRIRLQHHIIVQGQKMPLTELRTVSNGQRQLLQHPWCHSPNLTCGVNDKLISNELPEDPDDGVIIHVRPPFLPLFVQELDVKFKAYADFLRNDSAGQALERPLAVLDENSDSAKNILLLLGDMHYLLAHATLDGRGSAAKSELLIRSLAAAAGLELPPFQVGFVPDLEAFMTAHADFVKSYHYAFDIQ